MAIDLMVMPLSRYWAGDFITPVMQFAWDTGVRYSVFMPEGHRELPPGQPYGGETAPAERQALLATVLPNLFSDLQSLGVALDWDERDDGEIGFHRVDVTSLAALEDEAKGRVERGQAKGVLPRHLVKATIFLPSPFEDPLRWGDIVFGSLPALEAELGGLWPAAAIAAVSTFRVAIAQAQQKNLPLIVDD